MNKSAAVINQRSFKVWHNDCSATSFLDLRINSLDICSFLSPIGLLAVALSVRPYVRQHFKKHSITVTNTHLTHHTSSLITHPLLNHCYKHTPNTSPLLPHPLLNYCLDVIPSMDLVDSCLHVQTVPSIGRTQDKRTSPGSNQLTVDYLCIHTIHTLYMFYTYSRSFNKCHNDYAVSLDWILFMILSEVKQACGLLGLPRTRQIARTWRVFTAGKILTS